MTPKSPIPLGLDSPILISPHLAMGQPHLHATQRNVRGIVPIHDNEDILAEYDGSNIQKARWVHGPGIDEPLTMQRDLDSNGAFESNEVFQYLQDGLGSVTALTDFNGAIVQSYQYDSFGNITSQTGTLINPYTFTGREFDPESGLHICIDALCNSFINKQL